MLRAMDLRAATDRLPEPVAHALRQAKFRAAVLAKHATWGFPEIRGPITEPFYAAWQRRHPYPFPAAKYAGTWLDRSEPARHIEPGEPIPRRIFVTWTGTNPLTPQRERGLASIVEQNPGIDVVLVTPDNLAEWVVPDHPFPSEYEQLSLVHRSDYLRCYLLHHHGGGYADIKRLRGGFHDSFELLERSPHWLLGYTEVHRLNTPLVGGALQRDLRRVSRQLLGYGGLIARAHTPLTAEWYRRVRDGLRDYAPQLAAHPGNIRGDNPGYPLDWTEVLAHIVAPLTWKYQDHVIHDLRVRPVLRNYV